jgi:hypothetical protein
MTFSRTRLRVAAVAAAVAAIVLLLHIVVTPAHLDGSTSQMVAAVRAHPAGAYLAAWGEMVAFALAALACVTVTGLVRSGRGARPTLVGGWLNTVSFLALGFSTIAVTQTSIAAALDAAPAARAIDAMNGPALAPLLLLLFGGLVFPIVLGVGLVRAGLVGWWYVAVCVLGAAGFVLGPQSLPLQVVAAVPVLVQLGTWSWLLNDAAADRADVSRTVEPALA